MKTKPENPAKKKVPPVAAAEPCSALNSAWKSINPILRGAMDYEDFTAGWEACAKHIRENEAIQFAACPRCDHEFEADVTFESLD